MILLSKKELYEHILDAILTGVTFGQRSQSESHEKLADEIELTTQTMVDGLACDYAPENIEAEHRRFKKALKGLGIKTPEE